jgi:hypothetical protein
MIYTKATSRQDYSLGFVDPATIGLIITIASTLWTEGYSYYSATQEAMRQARMARYMERAEIDQVATAMHNQFPDISFDDWRNAIAIADLFLPLDTGNGTGNGNDNPSGTNSYVPYIIIGILGIFALTME